MATAARRAQGSFERFAESELAEDLRELRAAVGLETRKGTST